MKNLKKAARMAALAFTNGIRLHKDSIKMYMLGSFPTSYMLSILAQEEIGKAFLLEEHVFQARGHSGEGESPEGNKEIEKWLPIALLSHKSKQGWFSRQADDYFRHFRGKLRFSSIATSVLNGTLEDDRKNSTYVGLTKKGKTIDLNGKIINPMKKIKMPYLRKHITRVNDFIVNLIEGCRRGTHTVDTDELDSVLTLKLAKELESMWEFKSKSSVEELKKIRKFKVEN